MVLLALFGFLLVAPGSGQGPGPGDFGYAMQSRAVDTRVTLEITEGKPKGTFVGRIPTKPNFTYRFNEPPDEFSLDPRTGEIKTNAILDRESLDNDRYDLVVLSSQPTYPIEVRIVVVDANDNFPEFPEDAIEVSFSESAAEGTRLLLDSATDKDSGTNGVSDDYRIIGGNEDDKFKLVVTPNPTGENSYLHLETTGKLDREVRGVYSLNISARDGGDVPKYGYLLVNVTILDVNDNPPIFDHSDYTVSLNESVVPGTTVLQVMATDNDLGDNARITYYLSDYERQFSVDPETGVISTTETLSCPQQTCQQQSSKRGGCSKSCVFTVFARDHGTPRQDGRTYVTVNLVDANDHDPVISFTYFPPTAGFATVDENAGNGSVVAAVSVTDNDEGLNGETSVGIVSGNYLNHFRLDHTPNFDIVRVNGVLDREEISKYNLTIVASDKGNPPRTATSFLIIHVNDVNDHEPVFEKSEYSAVLSELAPSGTYVAGIKATDEDTGVNAQIFYAFVSGNEERWFDINPQSGLVTTVDELDREIQGSIELNISARDGGPNPKWAYTQLKVTILDENDEAPKFSQSQINVSLSEGAAPHTLVAMLTASDRDQGTNGSVTYNLHPIVQQKYPDTFSLDSSTGQLTTTSKLDREKISLYEVGVVAKDQGVPQRSSTATVLLSILDVNDNYPEFYPFEYFGIIRNDLTVGASILKVKANDFDAGENGVVTYKIESGSDGFFNVDVRSGVITLIGDPSSTHKTVFKLKISAVDGNGRRAVEDATVELIKETYLEEMIFENQSYEFEIPEDDDQKPPKIGRNVGKVLVKNSNNRGVEYLISSGDVKRNFQIDNNGRILTAKKIDREESSSYLLTILAKSGTKYGTVNVTVIVWDLNDNFPIFISDDAESIPILENSAVGQEVYISRARDFDAGINSRVSYTLSYNPDDQFRISETTGVIYLNRPIRSEPGTTLSIEVTATDSGEPHLESKHSISLRVEDVNDHTPVFDHTSYETSLLESTPVNERFFVLSASDADQNLNGRITYSITEGNSEGKFGVFPDGYLYVRSALDRENRDYYSLTVSARDLGEPPRSSIVPVVIHVIDENDNKPEFTNSSFSFDVRENEPIDSFVGKLAANDADIGRNAELVFSLSSPQNDFTIDPKNGFIKTSRVFDREQLVQNTGQNFISFEAIVQDNGIPRLKDKVKVNVRIVDTNDNRPVFLRIPYKVQISEGSPIGSNIVRLYATDSDDGLNGDVFYSIKSGNEEGKFDIDEATGQIFLAKNLDREVTSKYSLTVTAKDAATTKALSSSTVVSVDVLDENDNSPEFTQTDTEITVVETTAVNTQLTQFRATDSDLGVNSEVTFSITAGNRRDAFHIDPTTGTLFLRKSLDFEELSFYALNVTALDNGNPRLSATITFSVSVEDANDNPPVFPNTAIVRQIREGIPVRTPIVTVTAEDPDSGINGNVTYSISRQEPYNSVRHFVINTITGVISTALPIDREKIDTFRLTVVATDEALTGKLSAEKLVTVIVEDINDNAPVFSSMNAAVLPTGRRNHHSLGQQQRFTGDIPIMTILATDADSSTNGLVTYELITGNADLFHLDRTTGLLTQKKPIQNPQPRYQLTIKATDEAVQSDRKSTDAYVTLIAAGNSDDELVAFENDVYTGSVYENEPIGTSILTVSAHMHAGGGEIEYYVTNITGGTAGIQVDRLFDIDMKLGLVSTAAELDREVGIDTYVIEVIAIGNQGLPRTSSTKIHITVLDKNDSPPAFEEGSLLFNVSEDMNAGLSVATIRAEDPDTHGKLQYTLISGGDNSFSLDPLNGVLTLTDSLDRETKDSYQLTIRASDGVQHTDTTVLIQVTDTNDSPPTFTETAYSFDVPENAPRGSRVGQVKANDADLGFNSQLTYSVISDWANDVFSLNPQTGVFTLTSKLDYEEVQHYILVVQAQDAGHPSLSSTVTVYCNVLDLNDNAPVFDPMSYSNEVFEDVVVGTKVFSVSATDLDSGNNGKITYSIVSGDDRNEFKISEDGTVSTAKLLDRETQTIYNLIITATDKATTPQKKLSSSAQATITLKDVNDVSPEFTSSNETSILENIPINTVVMAIKAQDKDEGRNGYVEYYLTENSSKGVFSLGPVDGLLRVVGRIDREVKSSYSLGIIAKDRGDPSRSTKGRILVKVLDENDNSPTFDPRQYSASVAENASIGASVLQVSATDIDEGLNGRVRYSISSGDDNRDFSIAEDTGVIRVAKNLNYERKSRYVLTVRAEDCAADLNPKSSARSDAAEVKISVSDINDNQPTFLDSPYLAYVMENEIPPYGDHVITVKAYDADTPPFNSLVRYFIKEGDTDLFKINASSGEISLLGPLDREIRSEYTLSLVAMDTGSPPLTGTGIVKIIVRDVNDHSPEFKRQSYEAWIPENVASGAWVLAPTATDLDEGLNAMIKYSLIGDNSERFSIDQSTGEITTTVPLDREEKSIYRLTLVARDSSPTEPKATSVNLTIMVSDENDNFPRFSSGIYKVYLPEDIKEGQFVFGAKATDEDVGDNGKITYSIIGEHSNYFQIEPESGTISVISHPPKPLKSSTESVYNVEIEASDGGKTPKRASAELKIFLRPLHTFPRFLSPSENQRQFKLAEDTKEGTTIARLRATSPKSGPSSNLRYSIAGGNIGDALRIDVNTGEVQITGRGLDYETSTQYRVWIEAVDSDDPPLRSVLQIVINVTDSNDNMPTFSSPLYNATALEEESPPQLVVKVSANDLDSNVNGQVSYRLLDDHEGFFEIDSESGEIYTASVLDREEVSSYELFVEAYDHGNPQLSGSTVVLVTVSDKNDNPPRFTRLFSVNVTENAEIGSFVIKVTSSDKDINGNANATYAFAENPGNKFTIDPITGNVTVAGHLDREQQDEYLLKVAAFDGAWRAETPLTVTIQDQNDNAPEFDQSYYSFNFPELQRDVVFVGQVVANDRDKHGPNSVISYSLQRPSDLFTVDPASGEIFSKRSLRYKYTQLESSPENTYPLTILATDNGKPPMSSECLVTVNVVDANNNSPKFLENEYLSPVPIDATPGQRLLKVSAIDSSDFGVNAEVSYSLENGNGTGYFNIDKTNGWITLNRRINAVGETFIIRVRATDGGVPPQKDEVTVTMIVTGENEHPPTFTALRYQVFVPENEPLGSTILTVSASDIDRGPNGMIRYEISNGNEKNQFAIDPISGIITILEPLDYDSIQEYRLNITAHDLGFRSKKATATITITLTDINDNVPTFNQTSYEASIAENMLPGSFVFKVMAKDNDSPKNAIIKYSIVGGSGREVFQIDQDSGEITTKISFDYEENNGYELNIVAANPDSSMYGETLLVVSITGINEFYPRFTRSVFHFDVSESTEVGTSVGTVQATDQDAGEDGKVYYLFVGSSNDRGFVINAETGTISVSRNLDRETQSRVVLTVLAKNAGGIRGNDTDEAQVIVSIQDGNDPPEFLEDVYEAQISEGASIGTPVIAVKAIDKDVRSQNNQFGYSIIAGNIDRAFKIDPQNGQIETARYLDRETVPSYDLIIGAIDTGAPPETGTTTVKVHIGDINDNSPIFEPSPPTGKIMENEPANSKIMTLTAKDPDLPPNGAPFSYRLVGGRHQDYVKVDQHTGSVFTTKPIDREITPELNILIEVEDSGVPKLRSQHAVKIQVLDQNDCSSSPRSVHVLVHGFEGVPIGRIADVRPNDPDTTGDYRCKIIQQNQNAQSVFSIPNNNCDLHASEVTPKQGYSLTILGNDGRHQDVVSTVTVEFMLFNNLTIENSITIKILNLTTQSFLINYYKSFLDMLKTSLSPNEQILLYRLDKNEDDGIELTLAIKHSNNYRDKNYVIKKLLNKKPAMNALFQMEDGITIGYSPCKSDTCENGGVCDAALEIKPGTTSITDTQNIIFSSPTITHDYSCQCLEGFAGKNCSKRRDPCVPNPCMAGGQCRRQGISWYDFQCVCLPSRDGKRCENERGDVCSMNPCQNGGSCQESPDGSSFFCLCRPGYKGTRCEILVDTCRPNPCLHGGLCVSLKPGYRCSCTEGRYGRHCEKSTYGFKELSFMSFPSLDAATNDITFIFATTKSNALLAYNFGSQTGGRSDFVAVEIVSGKAVFSFGGARTAITSVGVVGNSGNLADGKWHKITATRNGRVISLSVADCTDHGDVCEECRPGDVSCYADDMGPTGTLNFNNHPLYIGGISSADPILERPDQVHSDDLIGCVHSVSINGRALNFSNPIDSQGIENSCTRKENSLNKEGCIDRWDTFSCNCGNGLYAPNCEALESIEISGDGYIEFEISKKHKTMQLLDSFYQGGTSPSTISLLFRTTKGDAVLFYASSNKHYTSVELRNGQLTYISKSSPVVNMTGSHNTVTDGKWHNLTLYSYQRVIKIYLDGVQLGDELDSIGVHDFLDPYLTYLSLGGVRGDVYFTGRKSSFLEGCLANFTINNEIQPFAGFGSIFNTVTNHGKFKKGCSQKDGGNPAGSTDPLNIGITLVIVFFVVLLVAILVSFVVFRLRKQGRENHGSLKQNGNASMISSGLVNSVVSDSVLNRSVHGNDNSMYHHGESTDMINSLVSKKFKEREILQNEIPRPQRPDIIEREVMTKNPPLPPTNNHGHDHVPNDINSEMLPEHYDLENASSIAPSDIDIVYHYQGYREAAAGVRKFKAPVSGYHHKHTNSQAQGQHRHSPHHPTGFPPRAPPVTNHPASRPPHQSTPLARLSPSSELSAQQPRILTLHDISGKPLQSALLATTSSSGGVGKDVLHSNSERSLNSPVMSQLSGQSSNNGRKVAGPPPPVTSAGLTAEEIERLNSRPRTSSLVSTLDAVSSSSEAPRPPVSNHHLNHMRHSSPAAPPDARRSPSTTDDEESGNDSFTCSEIEYDNASLAGEDTKYKPNESESRSRSDSSNKNNIPPPSYDGFDSTSYRGSMSTLVASDDDLGGPMYRPPGSAGSPATATGLGWDYLLNWGPNFESLAGVFKDIAELPDSVNGRVSNSLRLTNATKPSEEYV
nr:cadherin-related tumor suppressor [Onthophagus taurus]